MHSLQIDEERTVAFLAGLLNTPSPTGYCADAIDYVAHALDDLHADGLTLEHTIKGALIVTWDGASAASPVGLTAHVDTLGLMVKQIKPNGRLKLTQLGSYMWNAVEFEGVTILASNGARYRGTALPSHASVHIHHDASEAPRSAETMEIRIDAQTHSAEDTRALGIDVGDFVTLDPRVEVTDTGFIRSRHLDDKAGVAAIYGALHAMTAAGLRPARRVTIVISHYEEVGHGAATGFPPDLAELVTIDMAAVGEGQNSDEFSVGICAKDARGPYSVDLTRKLRALADEASIPFKMDIYPHYGSDGEAYWFAGGAAQVALIGPGVDASHAYERTHTSSVMHTAHLIARYLLA